VLSSRPRLFLGGQIVGWALVYMVPMAQRY
jgi:hypothetical protein